MKDYVIIKSYKNGITLWLDSEAPFQKLLDEIAFKFHDSDRFFGDSKMALSIDGREISLQEEKQIIDVIRENCDLNIVCVAGHDNLTEDLLYSSLYRINEQRKCVEQNCQFYRGNLKNREVLKTELNVVILGDVYPESKIISSKNIIILGGLYGEACTGSKEFVIALEMEPQRIRIGDCDYVADEKENRWSIRQKIRPKVAFLKDSSVLIEPLTKEVLKKFI